MACRHEAGCKSESRHQGRPGGTRGMTAAQLLPGPGTQAEGRDHGRRDVRSLQPRPLCDRRLALPDDAARRGGAAHRRGGGAHARARPRRRACSVLPRGGGTSQSGQTVNASLVIDCSKYLTQIYELDVGDRRCTRRARHRARRPQPPAQAVRALVPGRRLDRLARHHRRHDGEQFLRRALAALRHHARQRALDRRSAGRRHQGAFRPGRRRPVEPARRLAAAAARARAARASARARPTRSRRASRRCSAASAATISTPSLPNAPQHNLAHHPARLGGHARLLHRASS